MSQSQALLNIYIIFVFVQYNSNNAPFLLINFFTSARHTQNKCASHIVNQMRRTKPKEDTYVDYG